MSNRCEIQCDSGAGRRLSEESASAYDQRQPLSPSSAVDQAQHQLFSGSSRRLTCEIAAGNGPAIDEETRAHAEALIKLTREYIAAHPAAAALIDDDMFLINVARPDFRQPASA